MGWSAVQPAPGIYMFVEKMSCLVALCDRCCGVSMSLLSSDVIGMGVWAAKKVQEEFDVAGAGSRVRLFMSLFRTCLWCLPLVVGSIRMLHLVFVCELLLRTFGRWKSVS